jgi:hypothetical protein
MMADDLEQEIGTALRHLPAPRAPETLLPRVMARVEALTRRPWYSRAWMTWPAAWQVASLAALLLIVGGSSLLLPYAQTIAIDAVSTIAAGIPDRFSGLATRGVSLAGQLYAATRVGAVLVQTLAEAVLAPVVVIVALMCVACAAFGATLMQLMPWGRLRA